MADILISDAQVNERILGTLRLQLQVTVGNCACTEVTDLDCVTIAAACCGQCFVISGLEAKHQPL